MKTALALIGAGILSLSMQAPAHAGGGTGQGTGGTASVVDVLRANGFVSWRKIERDDGKWEVEDARHASGRVYDLDIKNGRIIKWDRD